MKFILSVIFLLAFISCGKYTADTRQSYPVFSNIQSNYEVTDTNSYGCEIIDEQVLTNILRTGKYVTAREIHDHYDTTGCTIQGILKKDGREISFTFDYGGIFYFSDGKLFGCGSKCCHEDFIYCTYSDTGLHSE